MRVGRQIAIAALLTLVTGVVAGPAATAATAPSTAIPATTAPDADGRYREFGDAGGFLSILPAGQNAGLTSAQADRVAKAVGGDGRFPPHYVDQRAMYDALVHAAPELRDNRLTDYFKDASFGVAADDIGRVYHPHDDVTVIRDKSFGVPHIFGRTRYATMFAQGYTTAEDRLFFMDVLRHMGRGRVSELAGLSVGEERDRGQVAASPYTEADLTHQLDAARDSGPDGVAMSEDLQAYTDGVNAFMDKVRGDRAALPAEYVLLGQEPEPWVPEDAVAIAALIGGMFGRGGGRELVNYCRLQALTRKLGSPAEARAVFDDLHFADDPESPTTSPDPAPYLTVPDPADAASLPPVDCTSLKPISRAVSPTDDLRAGLGGRPPPIPGRLAGLAATIDRLLAAPSAASNALLVAGEHTRTGHPIAVFGPQVGYSAPPLLVEKDVHGPGIDARGVGFLGVDLYVLLGRGDTYAWSATSSGADNVDVVVLRLCEPGGGEPTTASMGYEHGGACVAIETFDHVLHAPATPLGPAGTRAWRVDRAPDYGPVSYRGTLDDGTPIAIATRRSTYGAEIDSALGFKRLNDPKFMARGYDAFREATGEHVNFTFNWFYVDARDIGYQHSCACPIRPPGLDPYLPVWGTGEWDWKGFLGLDEQPHARNPDRGYLVSWNNRQAPGFGASDSEFSYGPVHRSQMLSRRIEEQIAAAGAEGGEKLNRSDVVEVMADAATVDLRGQEVLPLLLEVMRRPPRGRGDTARLLDLRNRLEIWADDGAHRADRDADGAYDDAVAPAVMDAWWPKLVEAVFAERSGRALATLGLPVDDSPRFHGGSAFFEGAYGAVQKDLRRVLGREEQAPLSRAYCGGGSRAACAAALWASLAAAATTLEDEFGTPKVERWTRAVADDEIRYEALVAQVPPMDWQNRPTFQQVVQLETARPAAGGGAGRSGNDGGGGSPPVLVFVAVGLAAGAALALGMRRRRRA